jgi:hypothetical protein
MTPPEFLIIPYQLIQDEEIHSLDERVYGVIYWLTKLKGEKCIASNPTLAELCKTTPSSLQNSLLRLERGNYILRTFKDEARKVRTEIIPLIVFTRVSLGSDSKVKVSPVGDRVSPVGDTQVSPVGDQKKSIYNKSNKEYISKEIHTDVFKGREDINISYNYLKEKLGGTPDGSVKENRRYCKLLLDRMKKDYPESKSEELICRLIDIAVKDDFHAKNSTSFKYLYYNTQKIIQKTKGQIINPKYIKIK